MSNKVFFPLPCVGTGVRITSNFGEPYPQDAYITPAENTYINSVITYFRFLKTRQTSFGNNSIFPNLQAYGADLSTYLGRVNFLRYLQKGEYQSSSDFILKTTLNAIRRTLFSDAGGSRGLTRKISFHPGIDTTTNGSANTIGRPVYAVTDGVVQRVMRSFCGRGDCGSAVIIKHFLSSNSSYFYALYGHITVSVKEGQAVTAGSVIGYVKNIYLFPAHLHFEIALRYLYNRYPAYPYKQSALSFLLVGAFLFDPTINSPNPRIDFFDISIKIPYSIYRDMVVGDNWTIQSAGSFDTASFFKKSGFVDPVKYLKDLCNQNFYSGDNQQICSPFNFVDSRCFNDVCVSLSKV